LDRCPGEVWGRCLGEVLGRYLGHPRSAEFSLLPFSVPVSSNRLPMADSTNSQSSRSLPIVGGRKSAGGAIVRPADTQADAQAEAHAETHAETQDDPERATRRRSTAASAKSANGRNGGSSPAGGRSPHGDLIGRICAVLDLIRPAIQEDGGDVEFVSISADGIVQVRFHGACVGCPSSAVTLQMGIEQNLRANVHEVLGVVAVP
jgi:Fe-S cluster biogenesis protein NfuA